MDEGLVISNIDIITEDNLVTKYVAVCDDKSDDHADNLARRYLGYDFARGWGGCPDNEGLLTNWILDVNDIGILVDDVVCDSFAGRIETREARVLQEHDCEWKESPG